MARTARTTEVSFVEVPFFTDVVAGCDFDPAIYENTIPTATELAAIAKADMESAFGPMISTASVPVISGKGGVCHLIKSMLVTTATYHEIITEVYRQFPNAKTTAKSIASIARDMRAAGIAVAKR